MILTRVILTAGVASIAEQAHAMAPSGDRGFMSFSLQGIAILLSLAGGVVALLMQNRKIRRENEEDARASRAEILDEVRVNRETMNERVVKIEAKITDFIPRAEIEGKIEHEKNNRVTADNAAKNCLDKHGDEIKHLEVEMGRMGEKYGSMAATIGRVEALVEKQGVEMRSGFDKLQATLQTSRN